jgi:maleylpyruvate isomerase
MILHGYFRSSAAYRVRIALNLKGLEAEHRFVHLRRGEQRSDAYRGMNPQALVPTLEVGDRRIAQSLAIIEYLEERHPLPPLLPPGAEDRAWVRSIALAIACDIHPLDNLRVLQYLEGTLGVDAARRDAWYAHWIAEGFRAIERQLAERASGRYAFGDAPGLADACLGPQVANAGRVKLDMAPYPRIRAVNEACLAHPAFDRARPEKQPDAE